MSKNMRCDYCAFANACKFTTTGIPAAPNGCNLSVAVPYCKDCEFSEKLVNGITLEDCYFCKRRDGRPVGKMDFCIWGEPKPQIVSRELSPEPNEVPKPAATGKTKRVDIYTDGACKGNPGPGGWGAIIVFGEKEKILGGGEPETTNNRMELTAVIEALSILKEPCDVILTTDSKYVVDSVTKGWVNSWKEKGWKKADGKPALNVDLWEKLLVLLDKHNVCFTWIKGHDGHPYNERCDTIACEHAEKNKK